LFLILDDLPVHRATPVAIWLAEHADAIKVFYRPGDSPGVEPAPVLEAA
jgi:hypothetical protein